MTASISRETLYAEVWAEPVTRVAAKYNESSSFLARVRRPEHSAPGAGLLGETDARQTCEATGSAGCAPGRPVGKCARTGAPRSGFRST